RVVLHIGEAHRGVHDPRARFHGARPLHAVPGAVVRPELADGADPGPRPRRPLVLAGSEPARLREPPEVLQPANLPGRLRIGAGTPPPRAARTRRPRASARATAPPSPRAGRDR